MAFGSTNDIKITITADSSSARAQINGILSQLNAVPPQVNAISRATADWKSAMNSLVGIFATWRTMEFLGHQAGEALKMAAEFEKLDIAVLRFSESAEHARVRFEWINEVGQKAYGIRTLEQALVQLEHVGIKNAAGGLEGLIGYLHLVGRTAPEALSGVVNKMTELYQLGNIGMDDALKELSEKVPFVMAAIREKMGIGMAQLIGEFRKNNMDFATIIKAVLGYAEEHFKDGFQKMAGTWDVLYRQLGYKYELFVRTLEQNGGLGLAENVLKGVMDDLNRLAQNGKFEEWARRLVDSIDRIGHAFSGGKSGIEAGGEVLVHFLEGVSKFSASTLEAWAPAMRVFESALRSLWGAYEAAPDWIKGGVGNLGSSMAMGALAGRMFGSTWWGAAGAGVVTMAAPGMEMMQNWMNGTGVKPASYTDGPLANIPGLIAADPKTSLSEESLNALKDWVARYNEGVIQAYKEKVAQQDADRLNKLYNTNGVPGAGLADSELMNWNKFVQTNSKFTTAYDAFTEKDAKAGLSGLDRFKADLKVDYDKALLQIDQMKGYLNNMLAEFVKIGDEAKIKDAKEALEKVDKQRDELAKKYQSIIEKEAVRWEAKDAKKDAKKFDATLIDSEDIDNFVRRIKALDTEGREALKDLDKEIGQQQATTAGDILKAEYLAIDQRMDAILKKLNQGSESMFAAYEEMKQKATTGGHHPSQAAQGLMTEVEAMLFGNSMTMGNDEFSPESREAFIRTFKAKVESLRAELKNQKIEPFELQSQVNVAKLQTEQVSLRGTMEEQVAARVKQLEVETSLAVLQAKRNGASKEELELIQAVGREKEFIENQTAHGTWWEGFREGLRQIKNDIPTAFQTGIKGAQMLQQALEHTADSLTDLAMTGKLSFTDMANSIIRDIIRMMIQTLFVDRMLRAVFGWFGGGTGFMNAVSPTQGNRWITYHHDGGDAGSTGLQRFMPDMWPGLASDEYPAVLRRGETVNKKGSGGGNSVQIAINVPVQVGGPGGIQDANHAQDVGKIIAGHIKTQVYTTIHDMMRTGGMLNAGFSG
jgi:hypothetical protein